MPYESASPKFSVPFSDPERYFSCIKAWPHLIWFMFYFSLLVIWIKECYWDVNSLQCLGLIVSCSNLSWTPLPSSQKLKRHILKSWYQTNFTVLRIAPTHLSLPVSKHNRPSQVSGCHQALCLTLDLISFPESPSWHANWLSWPFVFFEKPNNPEIFRQIIIFYTMK